MAITSDQKIDFLWKKLGFKAAKTDISSVKGGPNEAIPAVSRINSSVIWAQSGDIPGVQPSATAGVVTVYSDGGSSSATVECTEDATATSQRSWKTGLTDWIDTSYGSTYLVKVYADDAGQTDPETGGTQLLGGESGYEWFFDYDAGVLNFIGTSIPGALSGKKIYVKGSRYTGNTGVPESGAGDTATNVQFDPTNLNDIQSTDTDGNINLDPNGTGNVVVEGTNSMVLPVGTTVERDASPTQGGVRYNTTTSSFEGYNGSAWAGMGGLIDIDQDTYICAEVSSDSDDLEFYTAGTKQLCIDQAGLITATSCIVGTSRILSDSTTDATTTTDGSIQTDGGISAAKAIFAGTTITATGRILSDNTTNATSTTDGSVQTDGGLSVVCDGYIGGQLTVTGNLTVNGTTTTVNTATLTVDDKNIELGSVASPDNTTADGGGITLKGATDKTINWVNSTAMWTFNQPIHVDSADNTLMHLVSSDQDALFKLEDNGTGHFQINQANDIASLGTNGRNEMMRFDGSTAIVLNEDGEDQDFRVEVDDDAYAFFVNGYGGTGVVGVGTGAPNDKLDVTDHSSDSWVRITAVAGNKKSGVRLWGDRNWQLVNDGAATYGTADSFVIHDATDNATRLEVLATGAIQVTNSLGVGTAGSGTAGEIRATNEITAYYSDRRLKVVEEKGPGQDVEGKDAADVLTEISGVYYKESDEAKLFGYDSDKRQVGLIAQDVQKILPEVVVPAPFDIAEDGSSKSGEDYLTIKYEKVIPLLVNAINAQTGKITELKETVKLLERDMQDLKNNIANFPGKIEILRDEPQVD